ncbi:MbnP family protein [Flavihumibacter fluvii]|uniref:MbnP family protein n=1 Tax=Flavihumibacter fluvii TaxID=2838157 RepID=UPI001BDE877B|nr:MbnP family protein [Flavihumibacter fluvii]ULQ51105.1 hypothetical protein KJS93_13535 [Flavihumibacter fluvii]
MKKTLLFTLVSLLLLVACKKENSTEKEPSASIEIRFHPTFNGEPMQLNTQYTNSYGESFSITTLKFYTGQYALGDGQSETANLAGGEPYFLSDYSNPNTLSFTSPIKPGTYNELKFLIGVDSARNVSGVQSGALDPANGMFWTWNSGYIYTKIEGTSPVSNQPNGKIEYHIGGFQSPFSAIRQYTAQLTAPDKWELGVGQKISFDISLSLDRFFNGDFPLRITDFPVCTTPGELSANIADNIANAFLVTSFEIK